MITASEVLETKRMVEQDNLDVRTITMGISLLDCASSDLKETCEKIYNPCPWWERLVARLSTTMLQ